jgi:hypothetical protein
MKTPKLSGRKLKLCVHDILKKSCRICSPSLYCPCNKLIAKCAKCKQFIGRCCEKSRSMCKTHGGWSLCKCGSNMHKSRCSACGTGKKLCIHKRRANNCPECSRATTASGIDNAYLTNTSEICPCGVARKHCSLHGGTTPAP